MISVDLIKTGVYEDIGLRWSQEDEYAIYRIDEIPFFSAEVYDGHGGREAALIASEMLTPCFLDLFKEDRSSDPLVLIEKAYLYVDRHLIERNIQSGTTVAAFYVIGDKFYASNVGDTRVVIGKGNGFTLLTKDHKPYLDEERERIERLGGRVITYDIPRVQGILAISRALGDPYLKPYVSAYPNVVEGELGKENDYVIVACDGVWDVLEPAYVIKIARDLKDVELAAKRIGEVALTMGSTDNITVLVVDLRDYSANLQREEFSILRVWERKE